MPEFDSSSFRMISFGVVAENKPRGTDLIKVTPVEHISKSTGSAVSVTSRPGNTSYTSNTTNARLAEQSVVYDVQSVNHQGVSTGKTLHGDAMLVAKWIGSGGNRMTSPDVCEGETVQVYQNADTSEYFWDTFGREPGLRGQETICIMLGNLDRSKEENKGVAFDKSNSYWVEFSSHDGYLKIHTSKTSGEPFEIDVTINALEGKVAVNDDVGNVFGLDCAAGSFFAEVLESVRFKCKSFKVEASESAELNTPAFNNNSDATTNSGSVTTHGGTAMLGGFTSKPGSGGGKGGHISGGVVVEDGIEGDTARFDSVSSEGPMYAPAYLTN